jgi:hypothetical protein
LIGAFNSVYTTLKGFLSQEFWFSTFLPVALFAGVHAILANVVFGRVNILGFELKLDESASESATQTTLIIIALVVIAYALMPLLPLFRGLLDGSFLPSFVHDALRDRRLSAARDARADLDAARNEAGAIDHVWEDAHADAGALRTRYTAALMLGTATDDARVKAAESSLATLNKALLTPGSLKQAVFDAERDVLAALAVNNPSRRDLIKTRRPNTVPTTELRTADATNDIADRYEELLGEARREARYRYQILRTRNRVVTAIDIPRATLVGDARMVVERYPFDVYKVDFEFLWPRLLVAMKARKADDPMLEQIEMARAKVDFAVLSLVLASTIPLVWLPVILQRAGSPWLFLGIGVATPLVLAFFYRLVFESQLAVGDMVKPVIDDSRFLVLKMLRQAEPASRSEECQLWRRIALAEADVRRAELFYTCDSEQAGST